MVDYFYNMEIDVWSIMTLGEKVVKLGYNPLDMMKFFSNTTKCLIELVTDNWKLTNETNVVNEIEVLVVSEHTIETLAAIYLLVDESYREDEYVKSEESEKDLNESYNSEYDRTQAKEDDNEFNIYLYSIVEYVGVGVGVGDGVIVGL